MNSENNKNQTECPEESELQSYLEGKLSLTQMELVEQHIAFCDRCYLMLKVLEPSDVEEYEDEGYEPTQKLPDWLAGHGREVAERQRTFEASKRTLRQVSSNGGIKFGQVWEPKPEGILSVFPEGKRHYSFVDFNSVPHFVVIVNEDTESILNHKLVRAFPVHDEEDLINEDDLCLKKEYSPLPYSSFIQAWNQCEILVDNLDVCVGEINFQGQEELAKKLKKLGRKPLPLKVNFYPAGTEEDIPEIGLDKGYVIKNYKTEPLIRYRYKEFKETAYLRSPAESLRETAALEIKPQGNFWERLLLNWRIGLLPVGAVAGLVIFTALLNWIVSVSKFDSPLRSSPPITKNNGNIALPRTPNKEINSQNFNGSDISNSNLSVKSDSGLSNQNTNNRDFDSENKKNTNLLKNKTKETKKNSLSPKEKQKEEQQNRQPKQIQRIEQQPYPYEVANLETPKIAEDIGELPPRDTTTRNLNSDYRNFFLSPNGTFVKTLKPTLTWGGKDGEKYKVKIFDSEYNEITSADYVDGTSWTSDKELVPGGVYNWQLIPVDKNNVAVPVGNKPLQVSFKVLNNIQQRRVNAAEKTIQQTPSLKLARVYLENALFDDAITELENYLTINPNSKEAKRLLYLAKNPEKLTNSKKD